MNEFVLGTLCGDSILGKKEWIGEERFIEPMVMAFIPRSDGKKKQLLEALSFQIEFLALSTQVALVAKLSTELDIQASADVVADLSVSNLFVSRSRTMENILFVNCDFTNTCFNLENLEFVTFSNCRFFNCTSAGDLEDSSITFLGCTSEPAEFLDTFVSDGLPKISATETSNEVAIKQYVLEKFLPVGRPSAHKHRPIKALCASQDFSVPEIMKAINNLKKEGILFVPDKHHFVGLNFDKISIVRSILGRIDD